MKYILVKSALISLSTFSQIAFDNQPAQAGLFTNLYVFGDSFVDDGNYHELVGQPKDPYFEGRFSNGKLFVELLPEKLDFAYDSQKNYAVAGAKTDSHSLNEGGIIVDRDLGFDGQVEQFLDEADTVDEKALYTISVGGNDYLNYNFDYNLDGKINDNDTQQVVDNITNSIKKLAEAGAENFLIVKLFDYTKTPLIANSSDFTEQQKEDISKSIESHNKNLEQSLNKLTGVNISFVDLNQALEKNIDKFTNTHDPCLANDLACDTPGEYVFWDQIHPSASANEILADEVVKIFKASDGNGDSPIGIAVPEPLTLLGVATAAGFGSFFKRKLSSVPPKDGDGETH